MTMVLQTIGLKSRGALINLVIAYKESINHKSKFLLEIGSSFRTKGWLSSSCCWQTQNISLRTIFNTEAVDEMSRYAD